jgi:hypothetical protein
MTGHVPEIGGHDAETVGHDGPKYALEIALGRSAARRVASGPLL